MPVTIYHNPRCGKSRDTLKLIEAKGIHPDVIEYLKTPPSAAELKQILSWLGVPAKDILRGKEAAENGIDPGLPEDRLIAEMIAHPIVIERPIVVSNGQARVGRPPEKVLEIL
ncbi:arsenate reductase (glutaredoxin) [Telmatospirillum sp.]|uniref:arsenate reductase (glutaredoxin) n=1 Tax=Telmatospirillum sp. TaxID=2079197 RepID=UPI00284526EE|nr:arsenate reductase (glutaredoxin) [Telmatospirillum sp.]MDR3439169.1 arsenate reductase (glutaredoxin) [Telmatospirillum sp.]